jgi:hypothetical protein
VGCPAASCLLEVEPITRETKGPALTMWEWTYEGAGVNAELVVRVSDPHAATVKAWHNDVPILLPSAIPHSGSNEARVAVTLSPDDVIEVRLSGKPGVQAWVWVEEDGGGEIDTTQDDEPVPASPFSLSQEMIPATGDRPAACGTGLAPADWNDVNSWVDGDETRALALSNTLAGGLAWIARDGATGYNPFFMSPSHYYRITANADLAAGYGTPMDTMEPGSIWLVGGVADSVEQQRVLCLEPPS